MTMEKLHNHLNVAVLPMLGIFELRNQSNGEVVITGGLEEVFLSMLSRYLNFTYTVKVPQDLQWGKKNEDGSWTGLIGMIQREDADMAISRISIGVSRLEVVHFSYPYYSEEVTFAKKWSDPLSTSTAFTRTFSKMLWLCVLIYLIAMPVIFRYLLETKHPWMKLVLKVFGSLLNQSSDMQPRVLKDKILVLSFVVASFFITSSYISAILSYLTLPLLKNDIRSINELSVAVRAKSVVCSTISGTLILSSLRESNEENVRIIGDSFDEENLIEPEKEDVEHFIKKKKGVLVAPKEDIQVLIDDVFMSRDSFFCLMSAVAVRKNFPWKNKLDVIIHRLWSFGLYKKSVQDYLPETKEKLKKPGGVKQLKMSDLFGLFYMFLIGIFIAFLTLLGEVCLHILKNRKEKRRLN